MGSRAMKKRPGTRNKRRYVPALVALLIVAVLGVGGFIAGMSVGEAWLKDLPDYEDASAYNLAQKTRVYASDNQTLLAEFYIENREPLSSLNDISPYVYKGTVATEDVRFYDHDGVDLYGIARAAVNNFTGGDREGASTITQQFVRNTVLADEATEQSLKRKVREAYISLKLEQMFSKDEILLMYLNTVNYGSGAYGIQAAAQRYYSTDANNLTIAQAATLVGIPQSPTYNNPIDYPDNCLDRRNLVLNRMLTNGVISQDEYDTALAEPLGLNPSEPADAGIYKYPYFTSYVRQVLLENYSEAQVFKGGLTVTTTIDPSVQDAAEAAAEKRLQNYSDDMEIAMVAIDPSTGYIKALVGGRDYWADQFNLATQALRSPGSSFKTFTLTAAIEEGINPQTMVNCSSPINIGDWRIENYGGASYGTRSIASAFAVSSNTGFARLSTLITPEKVAEMATRLGVETPLNGYRSITLGAENVTVKDMASAYATIATGGIKRDAVAIEKITDSNGKVLYEPDTVGQRVISQEVAHAAEKVMEGVITGGTATDARLANGQVAAGKTGTSENWRDSYFVGITPQYSVAIWLGARTERQMPEWYTASATFKYFLDPLLQGQTPVQFPMNKAKDPAYRTLSSQDLNTLGVTSAGTYNYGDTTSNSQSYTQQDTQNSQSMTQNNQSGNSSQQGTSDVSNSNASNQTNESNQTTPVVPDTNSNAGTGGGGAGGGSNATGQNTNGQ